MDMVVFMRTLHHIPPQDLRAALAEARRVLRARGVLYVAEPLPEGDFFELTSLVEDELEVRAADQAALADAPAVGLTHPNTRLLDLDGDGVADALRIGSSLQVYLNDRAGGWVARPADGGNES